MTDDLIVYRPWPLEIVNDAISEFNYQMHNGADVPEISAGLHGLDFLTRASELSDSVQARLDGALVEAHMRIELLNIKAADERTDEENRARIKSALNVIRLGLQSITRMIENHGYDETEILQVICERKGLYDGRG